MLVVPLVRRIGKHIERIAARTDLDSLPRYFIGITIEDGPIGAPTARQVDCQIIVMFASVRVFGANRENVRVGGKAGPPMLSKYLGEGSLNRLFCTSTCPD